MIHSFRQRTFKPQTFNAGTFRGLGAPVASIPMDPPQPWSRSVNLAVAWSRSDNEPQPYSRSANNVVPWSRSGDPPQPWSRSPE